MPNRDIKSNPAFAKSFGGQRKIFVAISGGVDSAVSAFLLNQAQYDITGVFIKTWQPDYIECTWKQDRLDAMRICAQLDIPFVTLDLESYYKKHVIDYLLDEYKNNRVPNPDIFCNKYIKFGAFYDYAISQGADYIATGHYAQFDDLQLSVAADENKDQTYFLYQVKKEVLEKTLFPIGHLKKDEVREIAKKNDLYVADKKDSQGICMLGDISIKDFLKHELDLQVGSVVDGQGNVIGTHDGVQLYTIGERHGFDISKKTTNDTPYFVTEKKLKTNELVVSHTKLESEMKTNIDLMETNWLLDITNESVLARFRYRGRLHQVKLSQNENKFEILENCDDIVSGQSAVFYTADHIVIGGGIIK
jgi:tRNA-specific 2-thiouridylase